MFHHLSYRSYSLVLKSFIIIHILCPPLDIYPTDDDDEYDDFAGDNEDVDDTEDDNNLDLCGRCNGLKSTLLVSLVHLKFICIQLLETYFL